MTSIAEIPRPDRQWLKRAKATAVGSFVTSSAQAALASAIVAFFLILAILAFGGFLADGHVTASTR